MVLLNFFLATRDFTFAGDFLIEKCIKDLVELIDGRVVHIILRNQPRSSRL